jgi:CDP-diacylglycerol--serine O-phosphatidyltransferase
MDETDTQPDAMARRKLRRKKMVAVIPSLLTLGNVACGFGCITYVAKVGPEVATQNDLHFAAFLVFVAMLLDALDGPVARFAKQTSRFGAHLDSLADVISFGVAPALLMLTFSRVFHPRLLWMIAVLYVLCAVLRLARFNVTHDDDPSHDSFCGLPSPAAAGMVASLVIIDPGPIQLTNPEVTASAGHLGEFLLWVSSHSLPIVTLGVACLMVSRIRYPHVVNQLFRGRQSFQQLVKLIFAIVVVSVVHELAIPIVFFYFVIGSPLRALWSKVVVRRMAARADPATG